MAKKIWEGVVVGLITALVAGMISILVLLYYDTGLPLIEELPFLMISMPSAFFAGLISYYSLEE